MSSFLSKILGLIDSGFFVLSNMSCVIYYFYQPIAFISCMIYLYKTKLIRAATGKQYGSNAMKTLSKSTQATLFFLSLALPLLVAAIIAISKCNVITLM